MRECMQKTLELIQIQTKCIWIDTYEEEQAIKDIIEISNLLRKPMSVYSHSYASGIKKEKLLSVRGNDAEPKIYPLNVPQLTKMVYNISMNIMPTEEELEELQEEGNLAISDKNNIFIVKDLHRYIGNADIMRAMRDIINAKSKNYNPIIIVSPVIDVPIELKKNIHIVKYEALSVPGIAGMISAILKSANIKKVGADILSIAKACSGLTYDEISHILRLSIRKNNDIVLKDVMDYKIEIIKKTNILDYRVPSISLNDIGGNIGFKEWVDEVMASMQPAAQEFGCEKSKGYLALGVPGTAKTVLAEALANEMSVPFLKLDMSRIMNSKVGESEKNATIAVNMIKACAPCLLLVDEIEKTLSGTGSSNNSDAGTMSRVFGTILEFLAEDHGVFVVMTSNDVSKLPPELTRVGRVDKIFYFGLPNEVERREIFKIHFDKVNKSVSGLILNSAAKSSESFTGAEIKEVVKICMRKAYLRYLTDGNKDITINDINEACGEIVPIATSSREKISMLEHFAKTRAKNSSESSKKVINNSIPQPQQQNVFSIGDIK